MLVPCKLEAATIASHSQYAHALQQAMVTSFCFITFIYLHEAKAFRVVDGHDEAILHLHTTHTQTNTDEGRRTRMLQVYSTHTFSSELYSGSRRWLKHVCDVGRRSESDPANRPPHVHPPYSLSHLPPPACLPACLSFLTVS